VEVAEVVKEGTTDEGPLYVCVGGTRDLEAKPNPSDATFPLDGPNWTIEEPQPPGAEAYLSDSTGPTTTLGCLTEPGDYDVKARCGDFDTGDTITVTAFDVEIDTPSSFPAYVGLNTDLPLGSTVTPAGASGGTFSWSKVSGPGSVTFTPSSSAEDPSFSADEAGQYTVEVQYTKDGTTASDTAGTIEVRNAKMIFKVGGSETSSITRAETGSFEVVDKDGNSIAGATYANWEFDGQVDVSSSNTARTWSGTIAEPGTASCSVTFGGKTCKVAKTITVNARSGWSITPTCLEDNDPDYSSYPGDVVMGENRDVNHEPDIIWPRGDDFEDGYTTEKVSSGPNKDVWFISGSTFAINRETCINKFAKPNATGYPDPPNVRWHEYNESQAVDADGFLTGLEGHEAYGTPGNPEGHQKYIEDEEAEPNRDAMTAIEDNVAATEAALKSQTGFEVTWIDAAIETAAAVEPTGNWGPDTLYIYNFTNNEWDTTLEAP
jgi:hypothetical protein